MALFEKTVSTQKVYEGRIISVEKMIVELPNKKTAGRDIIRHPGAATVLPIDNEGYIHVVKQYRKPIEKVSIEIPAGKLDEAESPRECAIRELSEETGLIAGKISHVFSMVTTPAFCDEVIHFFVATDLEEGTMHTDDDEFLERDKIHIDKMIEMIMNGEIFDSKTITAVFLAKHILKGVIDLDDPGWGK
jgi:ADP-ribose pyrophosphatase